MSGLAGVGDRLAGSPGPSRSNRSPGWRVVVVGFLCLLVSVACGPATTDREDQVGDFRSRVFGDPDGGEVSLADFDGEPLVVNFFASWCPPCRAELPDLEAFHQANDGHIQLIGISHDLTRSSWLGLVAETNLTFPTYYQPDQEIFKDLELLAMPTTILVTANGDVAHTHGGVLNEETLGNLVEQHLDVASP